MLLGAKITWDPAVGVDGYNIYIKTGEQWEKKNSSLVESTEFTIALVPGIYEVRLTSVSGSDESSFSPAYSFTVIASPVIEVAVNESNITITWSAISGVDGYNVYLKSNGEFVKQNSELVTGTVYDIENLEDGNYEAYATSVLNDVESDASNVKGFEIEAAGFPVIESHETTSLGFVTGYVVDRPAGVQEGDLLVFTLGGRRAYDFVSTVTYPTGWQQIEWERSGGSAGDTFLFVAYKIATGSEPSSYTFTLNGRLRGSAGIVRISGASQSDPIIASSKNGGSGTNVVANQIDADGGGLLVCSMSVSASNASPLLTTPDEMQSVWVEVNALTSTSNITRVSSEEFTGNMTGSRSSTSDGNNFAAILIGIRA